MSPTSAAQDAPAADGTQSIRRVVGVLRAVAAAGPRGASLAEVSMALSLPRSTVHRMLKCLVDEGAMEAVESKRYVTGRLVHELSLTAHSSAVEVARWRPVVEWIAARTGATAYLMRRSGVESVCLVKADGHSLVRFVPVEVGQRRLLGVGAGATALLAALDAAQARQALQAIEPGLAAYPRLTPASLEAAVRLVRRSGFAISQGTVVDDGFGMGVAVPSALGAPHLALSIAAHASSVTESSIAAWKAVLLEAIQTATS